MQLCRILENAIFYINFVESFQKTIYTSGEPEIKCLCSFGESALFTAQRRNREGQMKWDSKLCAVCWSSAPWMDVHSIGEEEEFFVYPFQFLAEVPLLKDRLVKEKQREVY